MKPSEKNPIEQLIGLLSSLPGYGRRSARRAALKMLMDPGKLLVPLAAAMNHAAESVKLCSTCGNLDAVDPCCICSDKGRTKNLICVVESVPDLWALERTLVFRGNYHVLGGLLSAMEGAGPEDLRMESLVSRARDGASEIIIALPPTVDGATTSHYLCDRLAPTGVPVTRLGQGVPMGGSLENLDEGTIAAALRGRRAAA